MANLTKPIILDETGQAIATAISTLGATNIGNLSSLTTTDKTSLVGAVNEVNSNKQNATDNNLETTNKTVVGGINELKTAINGIKDGTNIDSFSDVETVLVDKQDKTDNNLTTTNKTTTGAINELNNDISAKQNATDNTLETTDKTVSGAINEVKSGVDDLEDWTDASDVTVTGNPITITDAAAVKAKALSMTIEPEQDLHGYDKPWVGGAYKNQLNNNYYAGSSFIQSNVTITKNTDGSLDVTINGSCSGTVNYMFLNTDAGSGLKAGSYKAILKAEGAYTGNVLLTIGGGSSGITYTTATLNTATEAFTIENDDDTLHYCLLQFPEGATVTGTLKIYPMICSANEDMTTWAPYENICPISGHTEASVQRDSGNLLDPKVFKQGMDISSFYTVNADGSVTVLGEDNRQYTSLVGIWLDKGTYTYSRSVANGKFLIADLTKKETIDRSSTTSLTFTLTERTNVGFKGSYDGNNYPFTAFFKLERGETATPYVPYVEPKTYTIALGDTIYGGTVDFDSGVMTATHKTFVCNGSDSFTYGLIEGVGISFLGIDDDYKRGTSVAMLDSNLYPSVVQINSYIEFTTATQSMNCAYTLKLSNQAACYIKDARFTSVEVAKEILAETPLQVCYELATPTTIQLTPTQIQLLKGQNTLTANGSSISLTYQQDNLVGEVMEQVEPQIDDLQEQVNATDEALAELADKLPTAPTTDGSYVLTVTVADGTPTYSWESAT